MNSNLLIIVRHHIYRASAKQTTIIIIKSPGLRSYANSFTPLYPQISAFDHVPSLQTPLSGRLLTPEWAPFDTALVPQAPLRLISCSLKLLFSYYSGAVLSNSL